MDPIRLRALFGPRAAAPATRPLLVGVTSALLVAGLTFVATRTAKVPVDTLGPQAAAPVGAPGAPAGPGDQPTAAEPGPAGPGPQAAAPGAVQSVTRRGSVAGGAGPKARYVNVEEGVFADHINVGGTAPLQGALATYAEQGVAGAESRIRFVNDRGGIRGRKINLIYYDTQGQCQQALQGTKRLVEVDKLLVYGGTDQVGCVADYLRDKGVPLIGDLGLHRKSFEYWNIFPIGPGPYHSGHIGARFVTQHKDIGGSLGRPVRVGIIQLADDFLGPPQELLREQIKAIRWYGGEVVATAMISFTDSDCSAQIQTMRNANPDVVFLPATFNQALLCVTFARKSLLYNPPKGWLCAGCGVQFFADNIPRDAEPVYAGTFYDPIDTPSPGMQEYVQIMRRYHPEVDHTSFVTLNYYLSAKLNLWLIEQCGDAPTRRCLVDTANSLTNWDTGLGITLTYRPGMHTPTLKSHILTLKNKRWEYLYRVDPSTPVWWEDDIPFGATVEIDGKREPLVGHS